MKLKKILAMALVAVMTFGVASVGMGVNYAAESATIEYEEISSTTLKKNATANSEQIPASGATDNSDPSDDYLDGEAGWAFDEEAHWWHSRWGHWDQKGSHEVGSKSGDGKPSVSNPIWIQTGFDAAMNIGKLTYKSRSDSNKAIGKDYKIAIANMVNPTATPSDSDFRVIKEGTFSQTNTVQTVIFDEIVEATHVRLIFTSTYQGWNGGNDLGDGHVTAENIKIYKATLKEPEVTETPEPTPTATPEVTVTPEVTETPEPSKSVTEVFTDVYKDWYTEYVQYVYDNNLMTGIKGTTKFEPNANITKAQVAQVLYNMEEQPEVADKAVFTELKDVYESEWYANAVAWAYNTGVVTGDLKTFKFNPNADVTREQLALMLYRYASYKTYDNSQTSDFEGLVGADQVANWSKDGVSWAVGAGLISGVEKDGVKDLAPQGNATRAQVAAILQRFCEAYNK